MDRNEAFLVTEQWTYVENTPSLLVPEQELLMRVTVALLGGRPSWENDLFKTWIRLPDRPKVPNPTWMSNFITTYIES
ncbi:hypothetical protein IAD21_04452 [Abditibacteriota bacterium]|nr:hypothetical protein IAD21_04452 [Abditibacteriota bacterium]